VLGAEPATLRLQNMSIQSLGLCPPALFRVDQGQIDHWPERSLMLRPPGSPRHLRRLAESLLSLRELAFPQVSNAEVIHVRDSFGMLGTGHAPIAVPASLAPPDAANPDVCANVFSTVRRPRYKLPSPPMIPHRRGSR